MKNINFWITLLLFLPLLAVAGERNCGTMEHWEMLQQNDPKAEFKMDRIEQFTQAFIEQQANNRSMAAVITIPVVVHVVYGNNTENISDAQIQSQMNVLNADFRRTNSDANNTWSQAADSEIEFCLATVDPNGNATNGITRTSTSVSAFGTNDAMKFTSQGGKDAWPASDYLNMWVCDISGGILGYAQFPGGSASTDGVVMDYQYFGTIGTATAPFDLGRTATHEVGHWLNLRHIWGDGNCNADDFVSDTPTSDAANYGCATGHVSCNSTDMVQNYMDYSDDGCMNLFTQGQKDRMRALFASGGFRASLLNSNGCGNSGPVATCNDGTQNQGETGVDCGGPCPACPCNGTEVTVTINLDNYPEETTWSITDDGGSTLANGGTYGSQPDGSTVSIPVCLPNGCYTFTINDSYGDGICCSYGTGSYSVTGGGNTLASGGSFGSSESTNFCLGGGGGPVETCDDGIQNQGETGVDCGGPCSACPTCNDGVQNQGETDVDCGGPCTACPTCNDGIQNQGETGVDCGGPCTPCNTGGGCTNVVIDSNNFDSGWGIWNDGGSDCRRSANDSNYANSGSYCIRLRDNTSTSTMTTDNLNLAGFEEVTIDFTYYPRSMENNEDFWLQASTNGGSSYQTLVSLARGTDFNNNQRYFESVTITGTFTSTTRFRFRNDASGNSDWIYIDDVVISGCTNGAREVEEIIEIEVIDNYSHTLPTERIEENILDVNVFPNPASNYVNVVSNMNATASLISIDGKVIATKIINSGNTSFDLNGLNAGIYFIQIHDGTSVVNKKLIITE